MPGFRARPASAPVAKLPGIHAALQMFYDLLAAPLVSNT